MRRRGQRRTGLRRRTGDDLKIFRTEGRPVLLQEGKRTGISLNSIDRSGLRLQRQPEQEVTTDIS